MTPKEEKILDIIHYLAIDKKQKWEYDGLQECSTKYLGYTVRIMIYPHNDTILIAKDGFFSEFDVSTEMSPFSKVIRTHFKTENKNDKVIKEFLKEHEKFESI